MDVYMEFDERRSHRANNVNTNDEYEQTGYPLGLRVMTEAHSYGVSYAEDILFFTVKVRNESGDWCAFEKNSNGNDFLLFFERLCFATLFDLNSQAFLDRKLDG